MWTMTFLAGAGAAVLAKKYFERTIDGLKKDMTALRGRAEEGASTVARDVASFARSAKAEAPEDEIARLRRRLAELEGGAAKKEPSPAGDPPPASDPAQAS
jgi:hypothetical protein